MILAGRRRTGLQLGDNARIPFTIGAQSTDARSDYGTFGQAFAGSGADFLLGLGAEFGRIQAELFVAEHGCGGGVGVGYGFGWKLCDGSRRSTGTDAMLLLGRLFGSESLLMFLLVKARNGDSG